MKMAAGSGLRTSFLALHCKHIFSRHPSVSFVSVSPLLKPTRSYTMQNTSQKEIQTGGSRTQFDNMLTGESGPLINMCVGAPGEKALKRSSAAFKQASQHALSQEFAESMFQYGPNEGATQYRRELANFLSEEYQSEVDMNDLVETAGASQALVLLSNMMFEAGDVVFVEERTYFVALKVLAKDRGMKVVPVAMDDNGMVPKDLERAIKENSGGIPQVITSAKPYWAMVYTIPTFQNPTGACLSPERCQQMIELARRYNLLIVCDDVYNVLYFDLPDQDVKSPKRLFAYDNKQDPDYKGNVVSVGTFSKIFGPGVRLGWMEAPSPVKETVIASGYLNSGGAFNHAMSMLMASVIKLGLLKEIAEAARQQNKEQCEALCDALRKELPPSAHFVQPKGGYFVWVALPDSVDAQDVLDICRSEHSVTFMLGRNCSPERKFHNCIRLSFVFFETDKLLEAAAAIGKVTKSLLAQ